MEYDHRKKFMIEKTGVIGGLNLPEKAQHSRVRENEKDFHVVTTSPTVNKRSK